MACVYVAADSSARPAKALLQQRLARVDGIGVRAVKSMADFLANQALGARALGSVRALPSAMQVRT